MTTKAGTPILAKKKPCRAPMAAPVAMAIEHGEPVVHAVGDAEDGPDGRADTPPTEPTDRSISPSSSTKTMPTAIMPVADDVTPMLLRFSAERKFEFRLWKMTRDDDQADDDRAASPAHRRAPCA